MWNPAGERIGGDPWDCPASHWAYSMKILELIERLKELPPNYDVDVIDGDSGDRVTDLVATIDNRRKRVSLGGKDYDDEREGDWHVDREGDIMHSPSKLPAGLGGKAADEAEKRLGGRLPPNVAFTSLM